VSKGKHPFGDNLRRQANILSGEHNLDRIGQPGKKLFAVMLFISQRLIAEHILVRDLISAMLQTDPESRPSAQEVLKHPFFWNREKQLHFFQAS
jgi:serine/threonine protein kinase